MKDIKLGRFFNPTKGYLNFQAMVNEIIFYFQEKMEKSYEVVVGCDSSSAKEPFFPVAIVVLRKGEGGRFFLKKIKYRQRKFYNLHQRILEEVFLSCRMALVLKEEIERKIKIAIPKAKFEFKYIHADVGTNGITRDMVKEVIGLIKGNGFEAKIKPESFAATVVADRYS